MFSSYRINNLNPLHVVFDLQLVALQPFKAMTDPHPKRFLQPRFEFPIAMLFPIAISNMIAFFAKNLHFRPPKNTHCRTWVHFMTMAFVYNCCVRLNDCHKKSGQSLHILILISIVSYYDLTG